MGEKEPTACCLQETRFTLQCYRWVERPQKVDTQNKDIIQKKKVRHTASEAADSTEKKMTGIETLGKDETKLVKLQKD